MTSIPFTVVIPARYGSSRLPAKPLADINGRPMIAWVHERAMQSGAERVIVATDDERIASACRSFGAEVELTRAEHASGTDRIAEVAARRGWPDDAIVVNVQGDEPRLPSELVAQVAGLLARRPDADIATLVTPIQSEAEFRDPNIVKVTIDRSGNALYFSRAPIPWPREAGAPAVAQPRPSSGLAAGQESAEGQESAAAQKSAAAQESAAGRAWPTGAFVPRRHIGLYAYRARSLAAMTAEPPCPIELEEKLEQLRALWLGMRIVVVDALAPAPRGVDTAEDLASARTALAPRP
jgi:3-deoxy-manno-octulosonate cytidylyltransferase (CMP-KDO synthetase)